MHLDNLCLVLIYFFSILTFTLFAWDKHLAVYGKRRVPEFILLLFSFLFGAFGGAMAMWLFRHKTKHTMFTICVPIFLLLQVGLFVVLRLWF